MGMHAWLGGSLHMALRSLMFGSLAKDQINMTVCDEMTP